MTEEGRGVGDGRKGAALGQQVVDQGARLGARPVGLAGQDGADAALAVHDDGLGHGALSGELKRQLEFRVDVEVQRRVLGDEVPRLVGRLVEVHADGDHGEVVARLIVVGQGRERRHLDLARGAPGGPQVHHRHLAREIGQTDQRRAHADHADHRERRHARPSPSRAAHVRYAFQTTARFPLAGPVSMGWALQRQARGHHAGHQRLHRRRQTPVGAGPGRFAGPLSHAGKAGDHRRRRRPGHPWRAGRPAADPAGPGGTARGRPDAGLHPSADGPAGDVRPSPDGLCRDVRTRRRALRRRPRPHEREPAGRRRAGRIAFPHRPPHDGAGARLRPADGELSGRRFGSRFCAGKPGRRLHRGGPPVAPGRRDRGVDDADVRLCDPARRPDHRLVHHAAEAQPRRRRTGAGQDGPHQRRPDRPDHGDEGPAAGLFQGHAGGQAAGLRGLRRAGSGVDGHDRHAARASAARRRNRSARASPTGEAACDEDVCEEDPDSRGRRRPPSLGMRPHGRPGAAAGRDAEETDRARHPRQVGPAPAGTGDAESAAAPDADRQRHVRPERAGRRPDRLCGQGQLQPVGAGDPGPAGLRRRHRVRGRDPPGAGRRHSGRTHHLLGRGQDRRRTGLRHRAGRASDQRRVLDRAGPVDRGRCDQERSPRHRHPRQSEDRRGWPRQDHHRRRGRQVRRAGRGGDGPLRPRLRFAPRHTRGAGLPHRQPDHRPGPARGRLPRAAPDDGRPARAGTQRHAARPRRGTGRALLRRGGDAIPGRLHRHGRACAGRPERRGRLRAGSPDGRQCGRAAEPRHSGQ
uniref:LigA n=1 Tax=Parastrongyloides trichosuri TaxID=131310 RepID=A0A0N4ZZD2_PARTI